MQGPRGPPSPRGSGLHLCPHPRFGRTQVGRWRHLAHSGRTTRASPATGRGRRCLMSTRKALTAFLAITALIVLSPPAPAETGDAAQQAMVPSRGPATRAARLRTALDPTDPDTVWIGHIYDQAFTAGGAEPAGGRRPSQRGGARPPPPAP